MLTDISHRLTVIDNDNYVIVFIEQQQQIGESTLILNQSHNAIGCFSN